ncbi:Photosystem I assembly protein Ycf3 [subsurface metagenome]
MKKNCKAKVMMWKGDSIMKVLRTGILALAVLFLMIGICYAQSAEECYNKGIEYGVAGKFEKAQQEFKKALGVDPFYEEAKVCLELVEDALEQRIKPETALHIFKGVDYGLKGMYDEAIAEYKRAIEINPNYAEAHGNLGVAYAAKGMYDEAIAEYKRAIGINPNYAEAHNNLAVAYYYKEDYSLAIKHCDITIELGLRPHPGFLEALKPYR